MKQILSILLLLLCFGCRYVDDASDIAYKEYKVSTLLKKYEYFKDCHAQLDAKLATIKRLEAQNVALKEEYGTASRKEWAREDREQYNMMQTQITDVKASFNELAAEYNAAMAKFNYAFCNVGTLPEGASEPLPRKYIPYEEN